MLKSIVPPRTASLDGVLENMIWRQFDRHMRDGRALFPATLELDMFPFEWVTHLPSFQTGKMLPSDKSEVIIKHVFRDDDDFANNFSEPLLPNPPLSHSQHPAPRTLLSSFELHWHAH